jgi:hypothetical protein
MHSRLRAHRSSIHIRRNRNNSISYRVLFHFQLFVLFKENKGKLNIIIWYNTISVFGSPDSLEIVIESDESLE